MSRILRWGGAVFGLLVLGAVGIAGVLLRASGARDLPAEVRIDGLEGPAELRVDERGVPHIRAGSLEDALRIQGFVHARDRLWQMELLRRVARGRLSEVLGEAALPSDRFLRIIGLGRAAEATLRELDPATASAIAAYTEGVNAAIAGWEGPLPPEFLVLRFRPEPWTVADALAIEKIMAWDLAEYESTRAWARARAIYPDSVWAVLGPDPDAPSVTILGDRPGAPRYRPSPAILAMLDGPDAPPERVGMAPGSEAPELDRSRVAALAERAEVPALAARLLEAGSAVRASNSWVVGGSRSRSGKPLLANDMHLALNFPGIWYLTVLEAPGLAVSGMTIPGAPGVVAGRTRGVAWGFTNATLDDSDLFIERLDPGDSARYLVPGGSEPFVRREEVIRVRGGTADTLQVRETRHGPIVSDLDPLPSGDLLAFQWAGRDPSPTASAILAMNRSGSVDEFLDALRGFRNPHQNVVFADTTGRIGYWMTGRIPLRRGGGPPPVLPVPGWTGDHDWEGYLPFEGNPHLLDPPEGYIVTANHRQGWDEVSERISAGEWATPHRAERILELLVAQPVHDPASLHRIQLDAVDLFAQRMRGVAADAFRRVGGVEEAGLLEGWDGDSGVASVEATLFQGWLQDFRVRVRERLIPAAAGGALAHGTLLRALDHWGSEFFAPEADAAARPLVGTDPAPWGAVHQLHLGHLLADVPLLSGIAGFAPPGVPVRGTNLTVSPGPLSSSRRSAPWRVGYGPSQRHVSDLADPAGAGGYILPGGQSGLPRSRHALDQLPAWLEGGLHPLPFGYGEGEPPTVRFLPGAANASAPP